MIQELMSTIICHGLMFQGLITGDDVAISKIIRTSGTIHLQHLLDIGHSMKLQKGRYHRINKRNNGILNRLLSKLATWFPDLICQDLLVPSKKAMW
jgi:hypothetical protein